MNDIRRSIEYRQWKDRVKDRDGNACRRCSYNNNLHVHHIKPLERYPEFALVLDNGLTLCGNCHSELRGREETENLRLFLHNDPKIDQQLLLIEGRFSDYLERQLRSSTAGTRDSAVSELCSHLDVYPDSLREFVPHLEYIADSENWSDNSHHTQQAIRWLRIQVERDEQTPYVNCPNETCRQRCGISESQRRLRVTCPTCNTVFECETGAVRTLTSRQTTAAREAVERHERRVEQERAEEERIQREEQLRREADQRAAREQREREIISEYGSLEAYSRHREREELRKNLSEFGGCVFWLLVACLFLILGKGC